MCRNDLSHGKSLIPQNPDGDLPTLDIGFEQNFLFIFQGQGQGTLKLSPVIIPPIVVGVMLAGRIDAGFQGDAQTKAGKDYWRKNVATWQDASYPDLAGVDVQLDLYPEAHGFETKGSYRLINRSTHRMEVVPESIREEYLEAFQDFLGAYRKGCADARIEYVPVDTSVPYEHLLARFLTRRARIG